MNLTGWLLRLADGKILPKGFPPIAAEVPTSVVRSKAPHFFQIDPGRSRSKVPPKKSESSTVLNRDLQNVSSEAEVKLNGRSIESRSMSEEAFAPVSMSVEQSCDDIFLLFLSLLANTFVLLFATFEVRWSFETFHFFCPSVRSTFT